MSRDWGIRVGPPTRKRDRLGEPGDRTMALLYALGVLLALAMLWS